MADGPAATRRVLRYAFLASCVVGGCAVAFALKVAFDATALTAVLGGALFALMEWTILSFAFKRIYGARLSDFED